MSLIRREPGHVFDNLEKSMNPFWDRMRSMLDTTVMPFEDYLMQDSESDILAVDMSSDDKHIIVRTEVPGFTEDEINVDVRGNVLTISAESKYEQDDLNENWHIREMRYGKCARSILLPEEVYVDNADATLKNGVLTVKLPKQKPGPLQRIMVKAKNLLPGSKKDK